MVMIFSSCILRSDALPFPLSAFLSARDFRINLKVPELCRHTYPTNDREEKLFLMREQVNSPICCACVYT